MNDNDLAAHQYVEGLLTIKARQMIGGMDLSPSSNRLLFKNESNLLIRFRSLAGCLLLPFHDLGYLTTK